MMPELNDLKQQFLLDPTIIFLNHGSFGACPEAVFAVYQDWQRRLERQPVAFLGREYDALMDTARSALASYLHAAAANLIFVPNATIGLNTVARSLPWQPGDEILTTDHEYGAMDLTWDFISRQSGARIIRQPVPLPLVDDAAWLDSFWQGVSPRTRAIFISHISSPSALTFPITELCQRARAAGILSIIDGAHVPGHIPLDLQALDPDFYSGNCHKWLCAPKGSAFLYARADQHETLAPLVISWGWNDAGSFVSRNQWQGTRDIAAFLSVPDAIAFQAAHDWDSIRQRCHELALQTRERINALTGLPALSDAAHFGQMVSVRLPEMDMAALKTRLYDQYRIEVPLVMHHGELLLRVSFQAYNSADDADALLAALEEILA